MAPSGGDTSSSSSSKPVADERRRRMLRYRENVTKTRVILFAILLSACVLGRGVIGSETASFFGSSSSSGSTTNAPPTTNTGSSSTSSPSSSASASTTTPPSASTLNPKPTNSHRLHHGHVGGASVGGGGRPIGGGGRPIGGSSSSSSSSGRLLNNLNGGRIKSSAGGDGAGGGKEEGHPHAGYPIASVDFIRVETPFIIALWIFCGSLAKIGFHMTEYLSKIFPESCLLIVVGVVVGLLLFYTDAANDGTLLTPNVFLFYMLPPIILDAGYFMPNRLFFDHLGTILLMAVVGTIFNALLVGGSLYLVGTTGIYNEDVPLLPALLFGSLVSAVDPVAVLALFDELCVNEVLNIIVFGESLLNDAVTVVLYHMFEVYTEMGPNNIQATDIAYGLASFFIISLGGTFIGVIWGFLTGFITRFTEHARVIEPVFVFVMAYLAYLNAEIFHLSGILSTTFCGITMKNYVVANVSQKSQTTLKYTMKMLSSSSETIIFMLLGVSTVHDEHDWNTWFVVFTLIFCTVYRAVGVILLTAIANRFRLQKLDKVEKFVMAYGGLRGAVAFALVLLIDEKHVPQKPMFVTTTIAVIYFTVFFQGITIKPLVQILGVKRAEKRKKTMNERVHERLIDHMMAGIEELIGHTGNYYWREKFKYYDQKYLRPALLRERHVAEPKILDTYSKLKMRDAKSYAELNASASTADIQAMATMFKHVHPSSAFLTVEHAVPSITVTGAGSAKWRVDSQELEYAPATIDRDMDDARINRLLDATMLRPYRRHNKGVRYNRHAVSDKEMPALSHHKTYAHMRRFISEHAAHHQHADKPRRGSGANLHQDGLMSGDESDSGAVNASRNGILNGKSNGEANGKGRGVTFAPYVRGSEKQLSTDKINELLKKSAGPGERLESPTVDYRSISPAKFDTDEDEDAGIVFRVKNNSKPGSPAAVVADVPPEQLTATEKTLPWKRQSATEAGEKFEPATRPEYPAWLEMDELQYSPSDTVLGMREAEERRTAAYDVFRRRESTGSNAGYHGSFRLHDPNRRRHSSSRPMSGGQQGPHSSGHNKLPLRAQMSAAATIGGSHGHKPRAYSVSTPEAVGRRASASAAARATSLEPIASARSLAAATRDKTAGPAADGEGGIDNPAFQAETVINMDGGSSRSGSEDESNKGRKSPDVGKGGERKP